MAIRTQPRFDAVDQHIEKIRFLRRVRFIECCLEFFLDSDADDLRRKRDELQEGLRMLDDRNSIQRTEALIRAFQARLYTIPHERYLQRALRSRVAS